MPPIEAWWPLTLYFPHGRQEARCSDTQKTFCSDRAISAFSSIMLAFSKNYGKRLATMHRKKQLGWEIEQRLGVTSSPFPEQVQPLEETKKGYVWRGGVGDSLRPQNSENK